MNQNPIVNIQVHTGATAASDPILSSRDGQPVQRAKSKYSRRKMTEEEAIKELG